MEERDLVKLQFRLDALVIEVAGLSEGQEELKEDSAIRKGVEKSSVKNFRMFMLFVASALGVISTLIVDALSEE